MGLDMYAYAATKEDSEWNDGNHRELSYWRKHPNLHGWMEELYRAKGGNVEMFNGVELELTWEDLEVLERDILLSNLPNTVGFFFGDIPTIRKHDLKGVSMHEYLANLLDFCFY